MAKILKQSYAANLGVSAVRGWCLKYIDDSGKAPTRRPNATAAHNEERARGRIRYDAPPIGVRVIGYLRFTKGPFVGLGHVFHILNHGGGKYDINDSEVRAGARGVYHSIDEVIHWFGAYSPIYDGWSPETDGRQYAKWVEAPVTTPTRHTKYGQAKVTVDTLNVRNSPNAKTALVMAQYKKGEHINYDSYIDINGYRWLSYISFNNIRRYVAQRTLDKKQVFVSGGV